MDSLQDRIDTLVQWMNNTDKIVIFTGAGISTDSGLPDFRGPDGIWTRRDKGLPPQESGDWTDRNPNVAHYAIVELQKMGKLQFLISQNVDNLHLKSGIRAELLAELHGNMERLRCKTCEKTFSITDDIDCCDDCSGLLKSSVVDFGDSLPHRDLTESFEQAEQCDLFIVLGSSLVVTPAATIPRIAHSSGAKLVIVNQGETPLDKMATLRFEEGIAEVFPVAVDLLKK